MLQEQPKRGKKKKKKCKLAIIAEHSFSSFGIAPAAFKVLFCFPVALIFWKIRVL